MCAHALLPSPIAGSSLPETSGEGGIRTPDTPKGIPVFETGAISRSATSPMGRGMIRARSRGVNLGAVVQEKTPAPLHGGAGENSTVV